jgi:hypothetical protein
VPRRGQQHRLARQRVRRDGQHGPRRPKARVDGRAQACMKAPASRGSSAVIGEPWERKSAGQGVFMPTLKHHRTRARSGLARGSNSAGGRRHPAAAGFTLPALRVPRPTLAPRPSCVLAWRQTLRDFRAGELRLLAVAVMLAVAALTAVGFFADRLNTGLARDARQLLGGDAVVGSDKPAPPAWPPRPGAGPARGHQRGLPEHGARARRQGRRHAAGGGQGGQRGLPAARQAAAAPHARRRRCRSWPAPASPARCGSTPPLLDALQLQVGDPLLLGDATLRIARVIVIEPDRGAGFSSFAPRVMLAEADLAPPAWCSRPAA